MKFPIGEKIQLNPTALESLDGIVSAYTHCEEMCADTVVACVPQMPSVEISTFALRLNDTLRALGSEALQWTYIELDKEVSQADKDDDSTIKILTISSCTGVYFDRRDLTCDARHYWRTANRALNSYPSVPYQLPNL